MPCLALNAKKLRIFKALGRGRRAMISPALNPIKLRILQALRRGRRATISPALNAIKLRIFQARRATISLVIEKIIVILMGRTDL